MRLLGITAAVFLAASAACAQKPPARDAQPAPLAARPLAGMVAQRAVLLPAQYLRPADSLGWAEQVKAPREFLARVDDEIAFAIRERGVKPEWAFPEDLARAARRNAAYASDPRSLAAEGLRPRGRRWKLPAPLGEPLATQLRALVALHDARYAILPVEVRFEPAAAGAGRAVLHLALVDARRAEVVWTTDVASDPAPAPSPAAPVNLAALAASLAGHVADLIAAP